MAGGWSRDGAVQDQIDASIDDAVKISRSRLPSGESLELCDPGVRLCVNCQSILDEQETDSSGFNRRGSKDSQLR